MRKAEYSKPTPCGANRLANGVQCLMNLLSIDGGTPPGILSDTRVHFSDSGTDPHFHLVLLVGLEPTSLAALDFKSSVYANSTTRA